MAHFVRYFRTILRDMKNQMNLVFVRYVVPISLCINVISGYNESGVILGELCKALPLL